MRKKLTLLISFMLLTLSVVFAQSTVKGKVTDKAGQPLPGVSVKVQGTNTGTVTDLNGNFTINAQPNANLSVSFIGFATQLVAVANQSVVNITLTEQTNNLNDVVVVGFGTQKKSVTTGAISSVKASDLADQQNTRFDQALQGRTSGVTVIQSSGAPGAAPTIRVRGVTSINNSDPLYVIDGVAVTNGGLDNVNPNDIESIEVLKDASAAIYGSRASNGVIIVTTKKGKTGPPKISFNGFAGVQGVMKKVDMANATQYATLRNLAATNDGLPVPFANPSAYGEGTNWQNLIFSNHAKIQNYNLAINGGGENSTYYTSFGYLNQEGIVNRDISNYKRYNFTVNSTFKPKKWLNFGENVSYAYTRSQGDGRYNSWNGGSIMSSLNLDPITPSVVTDLNTVSNRAAYNDSRIVRDAAGNPYGISPYIAQEITNPLAYKAIRKGNYNWSHNIFASVYAEIEPVTGLKFRTQLNGKQAFYGSESFTPLFYLNSSTSNSTTNAYRDNNRNFTYNIDNTASYSHQFNKHNISVLLGASAQAQSATYLNGTYQNLPVTSFDQLSFNYQLDNAYKIAGAGEDQPYHLASYFGRFTYDYNEKYLFSGIIRRDGSSRFGSNNVYGTFTSLSAGWVLTKEDFFPKNSFIDFFKLRASYGAIGNEMSLNAFNYVSIVSGGSNYVYNGSNLNIGYSTTNPANPDLKWESTHTTDIGFDATIFNSLNVTLDFYRKLTKGMLQQPPLPGSSGFTSPTYFNVGDLENKGVELELNYNKNIGKLKLNFGGNIAYNYNKVIKLADTQPFIDRGKWQAGPSPERIAEGHQVFSFYGYKALGIFQSQAEINSYVSSNGTQIQPNAKPGDIKFADLNNDGKLDDTNDRTFIGDAIPHFTYGLTLNAAYQNFDFKFFGQGVWGNQIFQEYRRLDLQSVANFPIEALNSWTTTNPSNVPRISTTDPNKNYSRVSSYLLQSGAYFRAKTVQVGYTLPKTLLSKIDVSRVRIFLSSNNLFTITKYKGFDPEVGTSTDSGNALGIDQGIYPQARTFSVGLDINL